MSLEEQLNEAEQVKRTFNTPAGVEDDDLDNTALMYPMAARVYAPLFPVSEEQLQKAAAICDNESTVVTPIGGQISVGYENDFGEYIIDDIAPVPKYGTLLIPSQIPLMIDDKPAAEHDPMKEHDFGRMPRYSDYCHSVEGQEKPVEQVLAIPTRDFISHMLRIPETWGQPNELSECIYLALNFIRRGWCETDRRFLQLLPYMIFYKKVGGKYKIFVYQRGKGVGEERLALGCSIGVGGHINPHDFLSLQMKLGNRANGEFDKEFTGRVLCDGFWSGILNNVIREGREEIEMRVESKDTLTMNDHVYVKYETKDIVDLICGGAQAEMMMPEQWLHQRTTFFLDYASGDVEKVHLGMFIAIEVPEDYEIRTYEEELLDVGFKDLEELYFDNDQKTLPARLEYWSRSIVDSLYETIEFLLTPTERVVRSKFMSEMMSEQGGHYMEPETIAKIPQKDRWKIGTLSGSFDQQLKFYAMNAFVRA